MKINRLCFSLILSLSLCVTCLGGLEPRSADAAQLKSDLKKLTVLGSVLYIGAHPDDENTAVLAYLSRGRLYRTGYLSLTRGDGGQNLIGAEQGEKLGVIRTQELLAARQVDGAEQYFTRAIDFGFSKTPEESIRLWGKEKVLSDVVWVIRKFRPDVIILRFPKQGGGHGHHSASAVLGEEAFSAAGDPARFPEQLKWVSPWQAKRLLWNTWNRGDQSQQSGPDLLSLDTGGYNPLFGKSYLEMAGQSRSMHKSQGMGAPERRGRSIDQFRLVAGEAFERDLMDGVDTSWSRVKGGEPIGRLLEQAYAEYQVENPSAVVPVLVDAYARMGSLAADPWVKQKMADTLEAIRACSGLWLEAIAPVASAIPGQTVELRLTAINRSSLPLKLESVTVGASGPIQPPSADLQDGVPVSVASRLTISPDAAYSQPYWLGSKPDGFEYHVEGQSMVGLAQGPPPFHARFSVRLGATALDFDVPALYRWTDHVQGERYRVFEVAPEVSVDLEEPVVAFLDTAAKKVRVILTSDGDGVSGDLRLSLPQGWTATPAAAPFQFASKGESQTFSFEVAPIDHARTGAFHAVAEVRGRQISSSVSTLDYPHFPPQTVLTPAEGSLLRLDLKKTGTRVGYIMGSGDLVPQALRQIGYEVTLLSDEQLLEGDLSQYDAIVVGIRAYNTRARLAQAQARLLEYVTQGGELLVQYNTPQDLVTQDLGPYKFSLSRDRVSVEDSPMTLSAHPLLDAPNQIGPDDFAGWVQERGLNFPGQWDPRYDAPVSTEDPGEAPLKGGILFTRYGKGVYIYTSYSWFRQLPAGVPGAYRIFANLLSARGANGRGEAVGSAGR